MRHKLISPLAESLIKIGLQMFSYDPCLVHRLLQSSSANMLNAIPCSLVFIHFALDRDLVEIINKKMLDS